MKNPPEFERELFDKLNNKTLEACERYVELYFGATTFFKVENQKLTEQVEQMKKDLDAAEKIKVQI